MLFHRMNYIASVGALFTAACFTAQPSQAQTSTVLFDQYGWPELTGGEVVDTLVGQVRLRVPSTATLQPGTAHPSGYSGVVVKGPELSYRDGSSQAAYELVVSHFPMPAGDLSAWVDSVHAARATDDMVVVLGIPAPPEPFSWGTVEGYRMNHTCGDCRPEEYVIKSRGYVVVLSFLDFRGQGVVEGQNLMYERRHNVLERIIRSAH